jgi:hypothetical protein
MRALAVLGAMAICTAALVAPASAADKPPYESVTDSPKVYDEKRAHEIRGTVEELMTMRPTPEAAPFLELKLKTDRDIVDVHLAPTWYMNEQSTALTIKRGAELQVLGSEADIKGRHVFVAAEVRDARGEKHLRLRHKDGTPVWSASERTGR